MESKITIVEEKFYGRLKSRRLTDRQELLFKTLFKNIAITSFKDIDVNDHQDIFFEIGFGGGEHIANMALSNPKGLFIGCEPFVNGVAALLTKIDDLKITNIRIYQNDAKNLLKEIPNKILSGVFLLFPDPWPKRKHIRRRFLQEKTILMIHDKLKKDGFWRIASDHKEYKSWILKLFKQEKIREKFSEKLFDSTTRPSFQSWPQTRYEQKAIDEILYAIYTKV